MKLKNVLLTLGLALGVGAGVDAAVASQLIETPVETKADTNILSSFYIDVAQYSGHGGYDFYIHSWGNTDEDVKATLVSGMESLYLVTNQHNNPNFLILAVQSGKGVVWYGTDGYVGQTGNQTFTIGSNGFSATTNTLEIGSNWVYWQTADVSITDGAYLKGTYHGSEDWTNPATLSNDKVTESITWSTSENKAHATLELYAGDTFKFCRYQNGRQIAMPTTFSIETTDSTYYPVGYSGNNVRVANSGIYYITVGYGTDGNASNFWYYFDNSATAFANEFLNSMTCDSTGANEPSWNDEKYSWSYFSTWYDKVLDSYAKDTFYRATINDEGTSIEKCVSRHNTIVTNHHYVAFVTNASGTARADAIAPTISSLFVNSDNSALIIAIVGVSAILAAGGFFFLRRRKEN